MGDNATQMVSSLCNRCAKLQTMVSSGTNDWVIICPHYDRVRPKHKCAKFKEE